MYILDEMLFPFEVLVENYSEEDKIFQVISKINMDAGYDATTYNPM